jgi:predicted RecA/RadA family phage recombinase
MRSYLNSGDALTTTANRTAAADAGMLIGRIFGFVKEGCTNGGTVVLQRVGLFQNVAKASGEAWTLGAQLFWDNTNFRFTTTSGGNTAVGACAGAAAASGATVGTVLLNNAL